MRLTTRPWRTATSLLAFTAITLLAVGPLAADTAADPLDLGSGSTNVEYEDGTVTLGDDPAALGSSEILQRSGYANFEVVELDKPASAITVDFAAVTPESTTAEVYVRADDAGEWTQWTKAEAGEPVSLGATSRMVQLRVMLTAQDTDANPTVSDIDLSPASAAAAADAPEIAADPLTSTVFATREGLVGGTTANGHVIVERDHFVALPSRRGLSDNFDGTYSVQVCANSRCIFEPVWDVGPWNTRDDYWSPSDQREMWQDLPQGLPEAQAAYQDGYNGGLDEFGRSVGNPAGIDLADGAFWDGLELSDNSWVEATYLWTGDGPRGTVDSQGGYLNVRGDTSLGAGIVGMAGDHAQVPVLCQLEGEEVTGSQGTTNVWLRVHDGMYVSKAWVAADGAPAC